MNLECCDEDINFPLKSELIICYESNSNCKRNFSPFSQCNCCITFFTVDDVKLNSEKALLKYQYFNPALPLTKNPNQSYWHPPKIS